MCVERKKLVILGIPWDVDTEGLRQYMSQFGELAEIMVMKDRAWGRSRGFGYATFSSAEDAKKATEAKHVFNGRTLEVKVATPREEMTPISRKSTRIFVARIPPSVTDEAFHSYFMKYGPVVDAYMRKEESRAYRFSRHYSRVHRNVGVSHSVGCGYVDNHSRIVLSEPPTNNLWPSSVHNAQEAPTGGHLPVARDSGLVGPPNGQAAISASPRVETKMFIGRIPVEATTEDLQAYFSQFGWVVDVYLPKDAKKISHRGFGFVTFADEASAARVTRLRHYIHGREIAVDSASPSDRIPGSTRCPSNALSSLGGEHNLPVEVASVATENNGSVPLSVCSAKWGKKLFIGRIPIEATSNDLKLHFSQFGQVLDVYLPKDDKKISHRGFGFITFSDEISAEYASQKIHKILGQKIVLDRAAPLEGEGGANRSLSSFVTDETPLDGAIPGLQRLTPQQAYAIQLVQHYNSGTHTESSQEACVNQAPRTASRYRPY